MAKVLVYYFRKYDIISDKFKRSKRPATLEAILKVRGEAFHETASEVDQTELDGDGFLRKKA